MIVCSRLIKKSSSLTIDINIESKQELLGIWVAENKCAISWLSVLTVLKNRGAGH
ncbi:TPA: transposase [Citrobacter amalonaticus]|nr:transposase [Citrobacter amalonaticus]HEM6739817.1 transposase [Citrobacter amalonaticus]HEM7844999.1 transposase [Citrobacter amalonaticus]HEM7848661.1 transposase [Citrobacter amalonaticus]HEM7920208.1 transposase [Citrobacter amalonaticus]